MAEYQSNDKSIIPGAPVFHFLRQREIVMTDTTTQSLLSDKMVDMAFITEYTGCSDKWFYKLIQDGLFPKPIKMGRSSRWLKSEIEAWVQQRITESRA